MVELGQLYEEGAFRGDKQGLYTVKTDLRKAVGYYKKAREMKVPRATNNLGALYINNRTFSESNPNSGISSESFSIENIKKGKMYLE